MIPSSVSTVLRFVGWSTIPDIATGQAVGLLHRFQQYRRPEYVPPARGTPAWQKQYRYTFAAVVLGSLTYNLIEASRGTPKNFYEILNVSPEADGNGLKLAFRAFARRNHPDRVGPQGEAQFMAVRDAYEALKNPTKRFAYDRFGPDAMTWSDCKTSKEFLYKGLMQASGFYIGSSLVLLFMSAVLSATSVSFWRYLLLAALGASELSLIITSPSPSAALASPGSPVQSLHARLVHTIFPQRVTHQHILLLHQIFVFLSVALSRVVPVLFPEDSKDAPLSAAQYAPLVERMTAIAQAADREVSRMLHTEHHAMHGPVEHYPTSSESGKSRVCPPGAGRFNDVPLPACVPNSAVADALTREMEDMVIAHQLYTEGPLRTMWEAAMVRGREGDAEEPAGDQARSEGSEDGDEHASTTRPMSPPPSVSPTEPRPDGFPNGFARLPSPRWSPSPPASPKAARRRSLSPR